MEALKNIEVVVQTNVNRVLRNPYAMASLKIFLALYAAQLAPKLPSGLSTLFQNTLVKIISVALIAYLADIDFQLSVMMAIVFVLGLNTLSGRGLLESYKDTRGTFEKDTSKIFDLLGKPVAVGKQKMLESHTDEYPGCTTITLKDLLDVFDSDHLKLQQTVRYSFHGLMEQLPPNSDAQTKLLKTARAIGLPYSVELNDENAPFLASLLLNAGYSISKTCTAPN